MSVALTTAAAAIALPGAIATVHLTLLVAASLTRARPLVPTDAPPLGPVPLLFMIPAQDEEAVLGKTLAALGTEVRASDIVLVVADRCTDGTATLARSTGAVVVERRENATPGKAAALEDGFFAAAGLKWDAAVVLDADSVVEPGFVRAVQDALAGGAPALQARSEAAPGNGVLAATMLTAFALQGVAIPRGRDRLGVSVRLRGTGMILRRQVVEAFPWPAPGASEDLRYSLELCLAGVLPRHLDAARVRSANPPSMRSATDQRARWEAGRLLAARLYLRRLLRTRTRATIEAAVHLVTPPVALAALSLLAGAALAAAAGSVILCIALLVDTALLGADVTVAMVQARVPARTWPALLVAPAYIAWKMWVQLRALIGFRRAGAAWTPTPRSSEGDGDRRVSR